MFFLEGQVLGHQLGVLRSGPLKTRQAMEKQFRVCESHIVSVFGFREELQVITEHLLRVLKGFLLFGFLGLFVPNRRELAQGDLRQLLALFDALFLPGIRVLYALLHFLEKIHQASGLGHHIALVANPRSGVNDAALIKGHLGRTLLHLDQIAIQNNRLLVLAVAEIHAGQGDQHLGRLFGCQALEQPRRGFGTALVTIGQGVIIQGFLADLNLAPGGGRFHVGQQNDRFELLLGLVPLMQVEIAPALLVDGVGIDLALLVFSRLLVCDQGPFQLGLIKIILTEGQIGVRDILTLRVVLNHPLVDGQGLLVLLNVPKRVAQGKQHLIPAREFGVIVDDLLIELDGLFPPAHLDDPQSLLAPGYLLANFVVCWILGQLVVEFLGLEENRHGLFEIILRQAEQQRRLLAGILFVFQQGQNLLTDKFALLCHLHVDFAHATMLLVFQTRLGFFLL